MVGISIHAPAGGASNRMSHHYLVVKKFQFTPLREGLQTWWMKDAGKVNFNSRPCGRGFQTVMKEQENSIISIHAPAGGASGFWDLESIVYEGFQFTPLREGLHDLS